ncbi:MAG: alpha/beta fold hydrolase [Anaerolineae bacterium]|nr:alpha/beta fold hydrolase [Anaerolineae bacterium]
MKKRLRGIKRQTFLYDYSLYRTNVPIPDTPDQSVSVIDMHPEGVEQTILFQHGFAGAAESWEFQINHYAPNYRVVVPDLRGHGQSDAPYSDYTMEELVADMHAIVEHLNLPEKFILIGHSFGGSVSVEYANAYPERIEKLVLIATAAEWPAPWYAHYLARIPLRIIKPLWKYRPRFDAEAHVLKRMFLNNLHIWQGWSLLRNITMSTLVITGERDFVFPRHVYEEVGKLIPNAEVYDVGVSKHKVQLERHQAVNRIIDRFINEKRSSWREDGNSNQQARPWLAHYGKDIPSSIPIPRHPLYKFLEGAADWRPRQTAIIFYGQKISYEELNEKVNQFAYALRKLGVEQGDRVMLVLPNCPQIVIAYYAILKIGAVAVLPNPDADAPRIVHQAETTQAKVFITLSANSKLAAVIKQTTDVETIIFANIRSLITDNVYQRLLQEIGSDGNDPNESAARAVGVLMLDIMQNEPTENPNIDVSYQSLANINFTSGTTDAPRGVCLTHHNLVANALQTRHWIPGLLYGKETVLMVIPILHSYGMTSGMNISIAIAAKMVLLSVFDLQQVLEHIKQYKPTLFPGVPSMYTAINQAPNIRDYELSSIKACISGAAPLPIEVQEAFEKLTRGRLVEGYGLTEASPVTHANLLYGLRKVGSIGIPIPNTDAKIVDIVTREDLAQGKVGELLVKGPQVMQGYWDERQDKSSESVVRDGWLYTGDVAVMDSDGYFKIISRKRDTIFTGSYSVYPRDVEEVLYENNKVLEVAVVGIGQEDGEQKVKAYVVPRPGTHLSAEELLDLCKRRLEEYAVPWEIEFREKLPKSFIGKVLRRLLTEEKDDK